jgi:ABC-type tungstate transport system substrate-binding protein
MKYVNQSQPVHRVRWGVNVNPMVHAMLMMPIVIMMAHVSVLNVQPEMKDGPVVFKACVIKMKVVNLWCVKKECVYLLNVNLAT